jgi:hypothetical protein
MYSQIDPRLAHLTNEQIETLVSRYYSGENIKVLIQEYQVDCIENQLYKLFPPLTLHQMVCPYCGIPMVRERLARSSFRYEKRSILCPCCGHIDDVSCRCKGCILEIEEAKELKRLKEKELIAVLCSNWDVEPKNPVSVENLTLRQAVTIISLVRACSYMDLPEDATSKSNEIHLNPLGDAQVPFTPGIDLGQTLINELIDCGIASLSEYSNSKAFSFNDKDEFVGIFSQLIGFKIRGEDPQRLIRDIEHYSANTELWPHGWKDEIEQLWLDIAFSEAKEFFLHMAQERGLPDVSGKAMDEMLLNLLQDFSVAQCYRVIWAGSKEAADFLVRKKCNKRHAANYMIGACQRWADRARAEKWEVPKHKRNYDFPRTMIDYVFFDTFLKVGDIGFRDNPKMIDLHAITKWYV